MSQQQNAQPTPEDRAMALEAQVQELSALVEYLTQRASMMNLEVRVRDRRLAELERERAELSASLGTQDARDLLDEA